MADRTQRLKGKANETVGKAKANTRAQTGNKKTEAKGVGSAPRCAASASSYARGPSSYSSEVDPSTSVKRNVTVPDGNASIRVRIPPLHRNAKSKPQGSFPNTGRASVTSFDPSPRNRFVVVSTGKGRLRRS
jgi:hypothetical protein